MDSTPQVRRLASRWPWLAAVLAAGVLAGFPDPLQCGRAWAQEAKPPTEVPENVTAPAQGLSESELGDLAPEARGPRELLHLLGVSPSQFGAIEDHVTVDQIDRETLLLILHRLSRFDPQDFHEWTQSRLPMDTASREPKRYRGSLVQIQGTVAEQQVAALPEESALRYGFSRVYFLWVKDAGEMPPCLVITPHVPASWRSTGKGGTGERGAWQGMFYQWAESDGQEVPVWLARHTAWFPKQTDVSAGIEPEHILLASLGVDIGRLKDARPRGPLTSDDTEGFYQMLAAVSRQPSDSIWKQARAPEDLESFLSRPEAEIGRIYRCRGTARRAVRVVVPEPLAQRFGLDHYYEIDLFMPLPKVVRFIDSSDSENVKAFGDYPIVYCTPELPPGMPVGENIHQPVEVAGFYFKLWTYRSQYMSGDQAESRLRQVSPLLIGAALKPITVQPRSSRAATIAIAAGAVGLLAGAVAWAWVWARSDRRAMRRLRQWRGGKPAP